MWRMAQSNTGFVTCFKQRTSCLQLGTPDLSIVVRETLPWFGKPTIATSEHLAVTFPWLPPCRLFFGQVISHGRVCTSKLRHRPGKSRDLGLLDVARILFLHVAALNLCQEQSSAWCIHYCLQPRH